MNLSEDESLFLRDLVKASRQKVHTVKWVDRDGVERQTVLNHAEATKLAAIAGRLRISNHEVLRQAAHIPVVRESKKTGESGADA